MAEIRRVATSVPRLAVESGRLIADKHVLVCKPGSGGPSGPSSSNRVMTGVGNGVFAIVNNVSVRKHDRINALEIVERTIPDHELEQELTKLESIRAHFAPGSDESPFALMTNSFVDSATESFRKQKINAEAAISHVISGNIQGLITAVEKLKTEKVAPAQVQKAPKAEKKEVKEEKK